MARFFGWIRGLLRTKEQRPEGSRPAPPPRFEGPTSFDDDHNTFALALHGQLLERGRNLFFSPFSVRAALVMASAGASGETAHEMRRALRLGPSGERAHKVLGEIIERLTAGSSGGTYELALASSLFCQEGTPLQAKFVQLIKRYYGGGVSLVDFQRNAERARAEINQWVEDKTKQRIQGLISAELPKDTRLLLANAAYFKGKWLQPFPKDPTDKDTFYLEGGGTTQTPLMRQQAIVRYGSADDFQAVELEYQGGSLSMLVLLPNETDGLRDLENRLSAPMLRECVERMQRREVKLFLPRFGMTWDASMERTLRAIGMHLAFRRGEADFSGINGLKPPHEDSFFLSEVVHKAFVDVNEEGTEAAAATGITVLKSAPSSKPPPVPVFRADHPFLFAIRDQGSGAILFLGRLANPAQTT